VLDVRKREEEKMQRMAMLLREMLQKGAEGNAAEGAGALVMH
jgi:hypothetical protein